MMWRDHGSEGEGPGQLLFSLKQSSIAHQWQLRKVSVTWAAMCPSLHVLQPSSQWCSSLDDRAYGQATSSMQMGISALLAIPALRPLFSFH